MRIMANPPMSPRLFNSNRGGITPNIPEGPESLEQGVR